MSKTCPKNTQDKSTGELSKPLILNDITKRKLVGSPISDITPNDRLKLLSRLQKHKDFAVTPDEIPNDLFNLQPLENDDYNYLDTSSIKQLEDRKIELKKMERDLLQQITVIEDACTKFYYPDEDNS